MNDFKLYGEYVEQKPNKAGVMIVSLLIGVGVGAIISLLFVPQAGQETRQFLRRKYDDTVRGISEQAGNLRQKGSGLLAATRNKVTPFSRAKEQVRG